MYYCSFFPGFDHLHGWEGMLPPAWTFFSCCDIRKGSCKSVSVGTGKSKGCLHNCQSKIFKVTFYTYCCTCNATAGFRNHYQVCMEIHFMWCRLFPHSCEQGSQLEVQVLISFHWMCLLQQSSEMQGQSVTSAEMAQQRFSSMQFLPTHLTAPGSSRMHWNRMWEAVAGVY